MKFGDAENPLLVSCRSGARKSMPGMMETVLNVGPLLEDDPRPDQEDGQRAVRLRRLPPADHDVLRRGHGEGRGHRAGRGQGHPRAARAHHGQDEEGRRGYKSDTDLTADDLKKLCEQFKAKVKEVLGQRVPRRSRWSSFGAASARCSRAGTARRAVSYRKIEGIPDEWGTACNVQSMVFGNMGDTSATGVAFTPQPGHRREQVLRRVAGQRPGRGRGGRHPHAQPAERSDQERAEPAPAVAADRDGPSCTSNSTTSAASSNSTTTTCRTSSSRSRKASSTCSSAATASGPARRP